VARCLLCGVDSPLTSASIAACATCLRKGTARGRALAAKAHVRSRAEVGLPAKPPRSRATAACQLCVNRCQPSDGARGICGTREAVGKKVRPLVGTAQAAAVTWWHDALPTNCCASWLCPASTACGYPEYSVAPGVEHGFKNLAVGYHGCTFDCLYCQSWQSRRIDGGPRRTARELADAVDDTTTCVCYFGGDPTPQLAHALGAARLARREAKAKGRPLRICFETNGAMHPRQLRVMADLALESGGVIKFDLKAFDPTVHQALTGASNEQTLENFATLAQRRHERPEVPLLLATTPLVPAYVDLEEVRALAAFIAAQGRDIPYSLLPFFSCFYLADLPNTSVQHAERCLAAARDAGLTRLNLGNPEVLRDAPAEATSPAHTRRR
jgi:pyruvate formate lyase activating enzyme